MQMTSRLEAIARLPNVAVESIGEFESWGREYSIYRVQVGTPGAGKLRVMIDAGIHGDEPAGVEAALRFIETTTTNESLLSRFAFTIFPCNNPTGFERNTRENADGIDLNRMFSARTPPAEAAIISEALQGNCFDLIFEMHEDIDAPGLYLYELGEDPASYVGEKIIEAARSAGLPINENICIEGMSAKNGIIRRRSVRFRKTHVPLALYAYRTCGGHIITLEPPVSALAFEDRVRLQLMALGIALKSAAEVTPANSAICS